MRTIWSIVEDEKPLTETKLILDIFSDDEDGTFPRVSTYINLVKSIHSEDWTNFLKFYLGTKKLKTLTLCDCSYCSVTILDKERGVLELTFENPIIFSVGGNLIPITKLKGELEYDSYYQLTKGVARQNEVDNVIKVIFNFTDKCK